MLFSFFLPWTPQLVLLLDNGLKANCRSQVCSGFCWHFFCFFNSGFIPSSSLISVSSYGERDDLTWRRPCRISGTETAGGLCASCSGVWARQNVQTSNHSLPSRSGTAFPLWRKHNTHRAVSANLEVELVKPSQHWGEKKSVLSCSYFVKRPS